MLFGSLTADGKGRCGRGCYVTELWSTRDTLLVSCLIGIVVMSSQRTKPLKILNRITMLLIVLRAIAQVTAARACPPQWHWM